MSLQNSEIETLAKILDQAMLEAREIPRLTETHPALDLADAYRIQDAGIRFRHGRGERPVGMKMGLTSKAKMEQMGLHQPIYGVLMDRMRVQADGEFSLKGSIHPKIEPEIAFFVGKDLRGKVTPEVALAACTGVAPALEILDSRFVGFKYFSLPDVVADNCSSSHFVVGEPRTGLSVADIGKLRMAMEVDGKVVQEAMSDTVLGNPVQALVMLCEILDSRGLYLPAGSIVLSGAATQAVQIQSGQQVRANIEKIGSVQVRIGS